MKHFDLIVIGGGSAGYASARTARESFDNVAIVDGSKELGGLCILRGCMPSKTVIYSAEVLHLAQKANLFGLSIPNAKVDMKELHQRKTRMVEDFKSYRQEQLESDRFTLFRDFAKFTGKSTIKLQSSGEEISADKFIISTGSVVQVPPVKGLAESPFWTSDDILDLDELPQSVIVLGGGIVACELAQYLSRIGTQVIQIQRSPIILKETSEDAAKVVTDVFQKEGIELYTDTKIESIKYHKSGFEVKFEQDNKLHAVTAKHLFNALGRKPATEKLNLEAAGVELKANGQIKVNEFQQSSNSNIYAAGDVTGPFEIVHIAIMQGEVAAAHAIGEKPQPVDYKTKTGVVFTDPQIASAGLSIKEAKEKGIDLVIADYPLEDHGKSILMEAKSGYVKTWADKQTGKLIGAECVGKDAGELIHSMAVAIALEATPQQLLKVHWYHPTLSEIWSYPLETLAE